ncbi:MAG: hypothetical protein VKK04_02720 [Synechococcales bacterium]|nr:hypothetical protein [Synechococcales bacterium]
MNDKTYFPWLVDSGTGFMRLDADRMPLVPDRPRFDAKERTCKSPEDLDKAGRRCGKRARGSASSASEEGKAATRKAKEAVKKGRSRKPSTPSNSPALKEVPPNVVGAIDKDAGAKSRNEHWESLDTRVRNRLEAFEPDLASRMQEKPIASPILQKAKETAAKNGWDWDKVEALARKSNGLDKSGLNKEERQRIKRHQDFVKQVDAKIPENKKFMQQKTREVAARKKKEAAAAKAKAAAENRQKRYEQKQKELEQKEIRRSLVNETVDMFSQSESVRGLLGRKRLPKNVKDNFIESMTAPPPLGLGIKNKEVLQQAITQYRKLNRQ